MSKKRSTLQKVCMLAKVSVLGVGSLPPFCTGKYLSEALILVSTNPQYDGRLFIDLSVQYLHENYKLRTCCAHKLFWMPKQLIKWIHENLSSYCGLVDTRISASDKDLPVQ